MCTSAGSLREPPAPVLRGGPDSALWTALQGLPPATLVSLWTGVNEAGRARIEHFWRHLRAVNGDLTGADLIAAGQEPGPAFGRALQAARAAKLDEGADRQRQLEIALRVLGDEAEP